MRKKILIYLPALIYFVSFLSAVVWGYLHNFYRLYFSLTLNIVELFGYGNSVKNLTIISVLPVEYVFLMCLIFYITRLRTRTIVPVDYRKERIHIPAFVAISYLAWATPIIYYAQTCSGKLCGTVG